MTLDEQDKVNEMLDRLHTAVVVLGQYDRETKEFGGALYLVCDTIGLLDGLIEARNSEKRQLEGCNLNTVKL